MKNDTKIRDLFQSDVTRDIPPVVYFHEQSPEKIADEVSEYIITGGWPENHPNHKRVDQGIHEQYVRLLTNIASELDRPGGPDLPTAWISGFYGSGKSSFAKILGLALNGTPLPDGSSIAEAWLKRDTSPKAQELRDAWNKLRQKIDPIAVIFDVGSVARDNEHIHAAAVRQVQQRLGYCSTDAIVADFELRLERDGEWERFQRVAQETLGVPWDEVKDKSLAEEDFSLVMSVMYPERYTDPMKWYESRAGTVRSDSPEEAVAAIRDMLKFRTDKATLFLVIDEVSQYVLSNKDRSDRLRAFATALGATLKGKTWLLALGQQKLDEESDDAFLVWAKDRFPPKLRVHLAATNIRDVVHKRLLQKRPDAEVQLRAMFEKNRPDLKLYAYGCETISPEEFIEVYPMLPGQIDLILQLTSALRTRSRRAQGDDQAIRGLLQLLGELFRAQKLADDPVGALVTLDQIYDVQHTALDSETQESMARLLGQCTTADDELLVRAAKTVAMLELIQDTVPTDAKLIAQCLYDRVDCGNNLPAVTEALEELRRRNLLGYSEKHGYKLQSSAAEGWERERRDIGAPRDIISDIVQDTLKKLLAGPRRPELEGRPFPWAGQYSDGRRHDDVSLLDPRDSAAIRVDFRYLTTENRSVDTWLKKSGESALRDRIVWLSDDHEKMDQAIRELYRSRAMVAKYKPRRESLSPAHKLLLQQEENRADDHATLVNEAVEAAWMKGKMYFRGRSISPSEQGAAFSTALRSAAERILPELFPQFIATQIQPGELMQLMAAELSGPSPKFLEKDLGILELDAGRYVPSCNGVVPQRIRSHIESEGGLSGTALLAHFGGPPYGYTANVVKACVAGLLRGSKIRIQPSGGAEITAIRDAGVSDIFEKDQVFRRSDYFPAGEDDIGPQARARICKFFNDQVGVSLDREDHVIADAVALHFPKLASDLREVKAKLAQLPGAPKEPPIFIKLGEAIDACLLVCRQTNPTVKRVKNSLETLRDGLQQLKIYHAELTQDAIDAVRAAHYVVAYRVAQLRDVGIEATNIDASVIRIKEQLDSNHPWRGINELHDDLESIRRCYKAEREKLIEEQQLAADAARGRIRHRDGFSTLTAEQAHHVVTLILQTITPTSADVVTPPLIELRDRFSLALQRAEDDANERLDDILSEGEKPSITPVDLKLRNREVLTEADIDALVEDIKKRLHEHIQAGVRVRIV